MADHDLTYGHTDVRYGYDGDQRAQRNPRQQARRRQDHESEENRQEVQLRLPVSLRIGRNHEEQGRNHDGHGDVKGKKYQHGAGRHVNFQVRGEFDESEGKIDEKVSGLGQGDEERDGQDRQLLGGNDFEPAD